MTFWECRDTHSEITKILNERHEFIGMLQAILVRSPRRRWATRRIATQGQNSVNTGGGVLADDSSELFSTCAHTRQVSHWNHRRLFRNFSRDAHCAVSS